MANSAINLVGLDFDANKASFVTWLQNQDVFKDYNFNGSNIAVLLDLLSYNTFKNAFFLNMVANEMFPDTAQLRDSVVSHAKSLNYVPRSFRSAIAYVDISLPIIDPSVASLVMPSGTSFTGKVGPETYTFVTDTNILIGTNADNQYYASSVPIYEGNITQETYTVNYADSSIRYVITNQTVDTTSLNVTVIEDNGSSVLSYTQATNLFGLNSTSQVFFLQGYRNSQYEVIFGDGVSGRQPKDGSIILLEYRAGNGQLPNGINSFRLNGSIDGRSDVTLLNIVPASGGDVCEDIESIRFNAPRYFTAQDRCITPSDYENLLRINFPEINTVAAYGGEDAVPAQYGTVVISVDLNNADGLPQSKEYEYTQFLQDRSAMQIAFVDPDYLYVAVTSNVSYNINVTSLNAQDIETYVTSAITSYASTNLDDFKVTLRYSQLCTAIDNAQASILSNSTDLLMLKKLSISAGQIANYTANFGQALNSSTSTTGIVKTNTFTFQNQQCLISDVNGVLNLYASRNNTLTAIKSVGTVDYVNGIVYITNLKIDVGSTLNIYAQSANKDITCAQNVILNIEEADITINITQVRQ